MSSEGHTFNDSGDENVGDIDSDAENTEPQSKAMKRLDKSEQGLGQISSSKNGAGEKSDKQENDSEPKSASQDGEDKRHRDNQPEGDVTKDELFTEQSTDQKIAQLLSTIELLKKENIDLKQSVDAAEKKLSQEIEIITNDMKKVIDDKVEAVSKSADAEDVIRMQKIDIEEMTRTISYFEESIRQAKQQPGKLDKKIKEQKENEKKQIKELHDSQSKIRSLECSKKQLLDEVTSLKTSNNDLVKTNDSLRQKLTRINDEKDALRKRLKISEEDRVGLTLRLSKIAGANLAFQNPNIADLGDPNRPTKLAEIFSELYDNQWTDAFEQIDLEDDQERIKRLFDILKNLDGHCLDVCWDYDAAVKDSLTNLTVTSKIKELKPERSKEAENTGSPSQNGVQIPSEKDTTLPLEEESEEEMTGNVGLCYTYMWHKKETEDIGGRCKMIKYKNDIAVKCISPKSMTGSECTGHVPAEGNNEEKAEKGAEENEGGEEEEEDEGKGDKTEEKIESGSFKQAAPDVTKDKQELKDDTDCKKEANSKLANKNDYSAEFKSNFNAKTEGNERNGDKSQHDVEPKKEKQTKEDEHKENVIYLKFDFDTLTTSHKQTISEIRRIVHAQLKDEVVKAISQAVLEEMELPRKTGVVSYVEECAKICWLARLHDPPVHIEFEEIDNDSPFNAEMYKAYTKTGKRLDYVVWPPVFLHKNGPMLSKGVAQGK
ncbi:synaptonemal complex protein 1-like isoform X2 [Mya arenaria]|uniref:synaptonemal complex protein 1-like isoform X2 n=1 Tax=Mya arenaria TaxID=6604 RepID=UPI0022E7461C|nr:synaptonemal complex protein 1-like isoform X2 [Mya arenaria]